MSKASVEYTRVEDAPFEGMLIMDGEAYKPSDNSSATFRKIFRSSLKSVMPDKLLSFKDILAEAFLAVYGFDGYNAATHKIATHDKTAKQYKTEELSALLIIASFLGLPSRLPPERSRKLDIITILRGFIGGWIPRTRVFDHKIWNKKDLWQHWAIPVKVLLILPLKLVTWPFKLLINLIKLVTELIPKILELSFGVLLVYSLSLGIEASSKKESFKSFGLGLLSAVISLFYIGSFLVNFTGRMLTSPEKSAKLMFHFFQSRTEKMIGKTWSTVIGLIFGGLSILYSIILWAIFLPMTIGFITAKFPIVVQAANWVMQLPGVGAFLSLVNNAFITIGSVTSSFISVKVVTLFSQTVGLPISNTLLFLGAGIASWVTPAAILATHLTDKFSNWWAKKVNVFNTEDVIWDAVGKFQSTFQYESSSDNRFFELGTSDGVELETTESSTPSPTSKTRGIVDGEKKAAGDALMRGNQADIALTRTTGDSPPLQPSGPLHADLGTSTKSDATEVTAKL